MSLWDGVGSVGFFVGVVIDEFVGDFDFGFVGRGVC